MDKCTARRSCKAPLSTTHNNRNIPSAFAAGYVSVTDGTVDIAPTERLVRGYCIAEQAELTISLTEYGDIVIEQDGAQIVVRAGMIQAFVDYVIDLDGLDPEERECIHAIRSAGFVPEQVAADCQCANSARAIRANAEAEPEPGTTAASRPEAFPSAPQTAAGPSRACAQCGQSFEARPNARFCSVACKQKAHRQNRNAADQNRNAKSANRNGAGQNRNGASVADDQLEIPALLRREAQ